MSSSSNISSSDDDWDVPPEVAIIQEIYEGDNPHEKFEMELERALVAKCSMIVIEPSKLGDETSRWISVGNCIHKTAVLSGFGSILTECIATNKFFISVPLAGISTICTGLYMISWQFDSCSKYQVETDISKLSKLPLQTLTSMSPVVLVRKDDSRRIVLHSTVSLVALALSAYKLYKIFR